jgi:hypothetical protein
MSTSDRQPPDLAKVIDAAETEVLRRETRPVPKGAHAAKVIGTREVVIVAMVLFVGWIAREIWSSLQPPAREQVARDLQATLQSAHESIEQSANESGKLPGAIPSASLSTVVRYEPALGTYTLSATVLGVRVTLQRDGATQTEMPGG